VLLVETKPKGAVGSQAIAAENTIRRWKVIFFQVPTDSISANIANLLHMRGLFPCWMRYLQKVDARFSTTDTLIATVSQNLLTEMPRIAVITLRFFGHDLRTMLAKVVCAIGVMTLAAFGHGSICIAFVSIKCGQRFWFPTDFATFHAYHTHKGIALADK
jgi:hypothetical protein